MNLSELQTKDIISLKDGRKIGRIIDAEINENGSIKNLIIEENHNIKNFFSRSEDIKISFESIEKIGSDVILVKI
jgi:YlmC/YmxH family sporulation protein